MSKMPLRKEQYGHGLDSDHALLIAKRAGVTLRQAEATIILYLVPAIERFMEASWDDAITDAQERALGEAEAKDDEGHREISPAAWEAQ